MWCVLLFMPIGVKHCIKELHFLLEMVRYEMTKCTKQRRVEMK